MSKTYTEIIDEAIEYFNQVQDKISSISGVDKMPVHTEEKKSLSEIVILLEEIKTEIQTQESLIYEINLELDKIEDTSGRKEEEIIPEETPVEPGEDIMLPT